MKEIKRLVIVIFAAVFLVGFYFICDYYAGRAKEFTMGKTSQENVEDLLMGQSFLEALEGYALNNNTYSAKLGFTGDIMFYEYQLDKAYNKDQKTFDFSPSFQYISTYIKEPDRLLGNLKTTLAGADNSDKESHGYKANHQDMIFNSPESVAKDLKDAGFDMVSTANKQALDSDVKGVSATIDHLDTAGLDYIGTFKETSSKRYTIENVNGINVGYIAYTNTINQELDPQFEHIINSLDNYDQKKIEQLITEVKEMKAGSAEYIVVYINFGETYASEPDEKQKELSQKLLEAGADAIIGTNPHVLQPIEMPVITDADGTTRQCLIAYSLGNFLTSQQYQSQNNYPRDIGMILNLDIVKKDQKVTLEGVELVPTFVNWSKDGKAIAVLPVEEVYAQMDKYEDILEDSSKARINEAHNNIIKSILDSSELTYEILDGKYKIK